MEAKETWDCGKKSFKVTVTEDSAPNDNNWIGFGFIFSSPHSPVAKNRFIFTHFAENSTLFDCEGRSR